MKAYVADTMAIILWLEKRKLPQKAKNIFLDAENGEIKLHLPAIALAEIGYLSERKRIDITLEETILYTQARNVIVHVTDAELVKSAFRIVDIPELHDRLIAASGLVLSCPVITNDPKIIASKFVATIWN